jgi:MFS family permease
LLRSELPSNLVLKKLSPKIWLPLLTILWGIVTMCLGFVQNYAGFVVVRAILGVTEGGLLPGIVSIVTRIALAIATYNGII